MYKYTMPEDIKNLITDDFLKECRNQLFRIHEHYSLDIFAEEGIPINTSTAGWYAAFGKACLLTHKEGLFNYWRTLPWFDSDIFDGELAGILIKRGFILGYLSDVIYKQLGIKEDDLRICNDCGKVYSKDMVIEIDSTEEDEDDLISKYRCLYCQDKRNTKDTDNWNTTDYYKNILEELDEYKKKHLIDNEEE